MIRKTIGRHQSIISGVLWSLRNASVFFSLVDFFLVNHHRRNEEDEEEKEKNKLIISFMCHKDNSMCSNLIFLLGIETSQTMCKCGLAGRKFN